MIARRSSGSKRADSAVEPTRSQNITVSWRRSAALPRDGVGSATGWGAGSPSAAIALSMILRWPRRTPSFSRSASLNSGRTSSSMALSRNASAYRSSESPRSQWVISKGPPDAALALPASAAYPVLAMIRRRNAMPVTMYHNPRCNTSRRTLAMLREKGVEPEIVEYLKTPYTAEQLKQLLGQLNISASKLLRKKEAAAAGIDPSKLSEDQLIAAMVRNPIIVERPI